MHSKPMRKRYKHTEIQGMLSNPQRRLAPYSYVHPQISPSGQNFVEDDDSIAIVSDARRRYINNGWMKNRLLSEKAEIKDPIRAAELMARDTHALMSMEGTLTPGVLQALYPNLMLGGPDAREKASQFRGAGRKAIPPQPEREPWGSWHERHVMRFAGYAQDIKPGTTSQRDHLAVQKKWMEEAVTMAAKTDPKRMEEYKDYYSKALPEDALYEGMPDEDIPPEQLAKGQELAKDYEEEKQQTVGKTPPPPPVAKAQVLGMMTPEGVDKAKEAKVLKTRTSPKTGKEQVWNEKTKRWNNKKKKKSLGKVGKLTEAGKEEMSK